MKAEYIPPKQDVVLDNEAPSDFYLFVTGGAVRILAFCENMFPIKAAL